MLWREEIKQWRKKLALKLSPKLSKEEKQKKKQAAAELDHDICRKCHDRGRAGGRPMYYHRVPREEKKRPGVTQHESVEHNTPRHVRPYAHEHDRDYHRNTNCYRQQSNMHPREAPASRTTRRDRRKSTGADFCPSPTRLEPVDDEHRRRAREHAPRSSRHGHRDDRRRRCPVMEAPQDTRPYSSDNTGVLTPESSPSTKSTETRDRYGKHTPVTPRRETIPATTNTAAQLITPTSSPSTKDIFTPTTTSSRRTPPSPTPAAPQSRRMPQRWEEQENNSFPTIENVHTPLASTQSTTTTSDRDHRRREPTTPSPQRHTPPTTTSTPESREEISAQFRAQKPIDISTLHTILAPEFGERLQASTTQCCGTAKTQGGRRCLRRFRGREGDEDALRDVLAHAIVCFEALLLDPHPRSGAKSRSRIVDEDGWKAMRGHVVGLVELGLCGQHAKLAKRQISALDVRMRGLTRTRKPEYHEAMVDMVEDWIQKIVVTSTDIRGLKAQLRSLPKNSDNDSNATLNSTRKSAATEQPLRRIFEPFQPRSAYMARLQALPPRLAVRQVLRERLQETEFDTGFIYIYWFVTDPSVVKIGVTTGDTVERRLAEWADSCGHAAGVCDRLREDWLAVPINHAHRVERLVHTELKEARRQLWCERCGYFHVEWFAVESKTAAAAVRKFAGFMRHEPYEYNHVTQRYQLKNERRIMALVADLEKPG